MSKRKGNYLLLVVMCYIGMTACGSKHKIENSKQVNPVTDIVKESVQNKENESEASVGQEVVATNESNPTEIKDPTENGDNKVDVDLTKLSDTMIYAEVNHMMNNPEEYEGKTIRIQGNYYSMYYEPTEQYYFYVLIADALECCQQGIEFVWDNGSHTYPNEYPKEESEVIITGVFETYTEEGDSNLYCHLITDDIVVIK